MGIIMMVGIVVSNGVLLVDFANVLRRRGKPLIEATVDAGRTRLRPILMTTVATIVGLIPMALGIGEGSETNLPLARAVIGGLTVSTVFTLFLVPALYTALERFSKRSHAPEDEAAPRGPRMRELVAALLLAAGPGCGRAARCQPPPRCQRPSSVAPERAPDCRRPRPRRSRWPTPSSARWSATRRWRSPCQEIERADALITQARAGWYPILTVNGTLHPPRSRPRHQSTTRQQRA